ncbi:restriction endonuclease subunit S [Rhizobium tubonense]|uniref:Restriction endonuclease subunit S n=1 Tax=Rhizobium tubonense TaxID=484088 RepID=A0A2W4E7V7_9HYPH|nr:restriction endonuclease subunit S [Rhizobium tubonense]PZM08423.1 restriction endonuclease subunit S [Rhizobium tubonense]
MLKLSEEWVLIPLKNLGFLGRGKSKHRPRNDPSLYDGKYPFVQTGDVTHAEYWLTAHSQTYSDKGLAQSKLWPAGTLCITIAANIAETAVLTVDACFPDSVVGFIPDPLKANTAFIKYSLDLLKQRYKEISRGTTQDNLSLEKLNSIQIRVPPLSVQDRVAVILRTYDDLIEVNQRRIAILEDMARLQFDEWFVRFRYPGHDAVPLVMTELGKVPEGWSVSSLDNLCVKITDGSHWSPTSQPAGKLMASVKDMGEWGFDLSKCRSISDEDFDKLVRNDCLPLLGDILVAKDGANLNKHTFLVTEQRDDLAVLSSIAIIRPNEQVEREYLTAALKSPDVSARIKQSVSGAAIPRIILKDFKKLPMIVPPLKLQSKWVANFAPLAEQCRTLTCSNFRLRAARDLLLPKLISGEIDVSAAYETFAEAAE